MKVRIRTRVAAAIGAPLIVAGAVSLALTTSGSATAAAGQRPVPPANTGIFTAALPSASSIDVAHETVTLPLYKGESHGKTTWYVIADASDRTAARSLGVNYAPKLLNALGTAAVQPGRYHGHGLEFSGTVNFGLHHVLVPGPDGFPPSQYAPGAEGDATYSPLVRVTEGTGSSAHTVVLNAPQVANSTGRSESVAAINYGDRTVTLSLLAGWVDGQFTVYLHTDASSKLIAALENSTYTPNLNAAPGIGNDEPPSARAAIIPVVNGPRGDDNPQRQGLDSSLLGQGDPFNVAQEQPSDPVHYTPVWDVTPVQWTAAAIAAGQRVQLHSQDDVRQQVQAGNLVSALPGTPNAGLGGINAIGAISNCPIIAVFPG